MNKEMSNFETILKKNKVVYKDRWMPTSVDPFKVIVSQGLLSNIKEHIINNIAYNLQYLQYLQLQIDEIKLHSIIECQVYKTYIITAMSIIEAIFHQILKNSGCWTKEKWIEKKVVKTTEYDENGIKKRIVIHLYEKSEPFEIDMDFNTIINKIDEKKILSLESKSFPDIKRLRKLRNRIHLQIGDSKTDTDYYNFDIDDYELARNTLYCILTDSQIMLNKDNLHFIEFLKN